MDVSIYRLRHQDILMLCVMSLVSFGIVMVQSASMRVTGEVGWGWSSDGTRQAMFAGIALSVFLILGRIDYSQLLFGSHTRYRNVFFWALATAGVACLVVLIPQIGIEKNGARRWLSLGICQVQPSELGKWAVVLFLAWWLTARHTDLTKFKNFIFTLVPVGMMCLLIVIQDFGTAALVGLCAFAMLIVGRIKLWHLLVIIPPVIAVAFWFVFHKEYRWRRMIAFLDPYANPREGYHIIQSLLSFATGGVTGKGLGNGIQKLGYLPEDTTDFIFAVICEELGLFGALLTAALYLGILYVAWQIVRQKRDSFGRMLAFGIAAMISLQAMINMAVATVSVPTKGLSLPLISAGGSGLVITCAALGLLYSVCRFQHTDAELLRYAKPKAPDAHGFPAVQSGVSSQVTETLWQKWTTH